MQSDCQVKKARFQFLFFFRQRRQKILVRRDPRAEPRCDEDDDLVCAEGLDRASNDSQLENIRSRLGWGITHI
jgi:hypothetical protein